MQRQKQADVQTHLKRVEQKDAFGGIERTEIKLRMSRKRKTPGTEYRRFFLYPLYNLIEIDPLD
jgi:hypothetical protein